MERWRFAAFSIRDICAKFDIPNLPQSPDNGQNLDGGIFDFQISDQSFIKENFHNSRTINDIDMKLGSVTKFGKINTARSKTFDDDVMSKTCGIIDLFPIYGQFRAVLKTDSGRMVCKTYISTNSNLLS